MSWMKQRRGNNVPAQQAPQVQMYNPNEHSTQNWQASTQPNNWYGGNNPGQNDVANQETQANYWQQPQYNQYQQFNQQQSQFYQENPASPSTYQNYLGNEPQLQAQAKNEVSYGNNSYQPNATGDLKDNYFANDKPISVQQKPYETPNNVQDDSWNWGWGDEDNNAREANNTISYNNVTSSFAQDDTWNWKVEEQEQVENKEVADLNPAIKRRIKAETITPQWSIESQNSQASSDDILQTSESDDRSPQVESKEVETMNLEIPPDNAEQPENYEVAPINDRNQYLETGQLSDDNAAAYPGVTEVEAENNQVDNEPPPGLSRMVLGETEPVVFSRMIPGEASSPEASVTVNQQSRSETIGADTPPAMDRSETLGSNSSIERGDNRRPDSIEGQQVVDDLSSGVRNLNVTEKASEAVPEHGSSDSDVERPVSSVDRRDDKRYKERARDYSPDYARDKKGGDRRRYRDRYYNEDTDYLSDREWERRRDEYDRKYSSLRKDKDRRRRDGGDYREGRRDYDYGRYEHYNDPRRSRPSSRSDSIQESFTQERGTDREHRRHRDRDRRPRGDNYNPYMRGYPGYTPYDPYMQYQYQYLENMRITNPQRYAEWYRKYYQQQVNLQQPAAYGMEDKTSIHSGRSSTNDELAKERYLRQGYYRQENYSHLGGYYDAHSLSGNFQSIHEASVNQAYDITDASLNYDQTTMSQRATPSKFANVHCKASIASGKLLKFLPEYAVDGQAPTIEISQIFEQISCDPELQELQAFPGPLIKGVTRKKTVIKYCHSKIENVPEHVNDPEAYVLMWELLILLLRQNGMVVGTDISELLMKDRKVETSRPASVASNASSTTKMNNLGQDSVGLKEEFITNKFREYLIYGAGKEALEWAMKNNLWGHALFLASKLDKRTYANVMMRFANGLPLNDPLQTLYQLLSGKLPASVTSVSDEKWGDWRPHLAMILSNTTQRPELVRKAITTLADTLMQRGSLHAAHFCYLMAQMEFSRYGTENARLVLLGADHTKPFLQFATNESIHMTEIYEFACSLNDASFIIPEFQAYKYLLATRLADYGFLETALSYLERCSISLVYLMGNSGTVSSSLIEKVCDLSDRLKFNDLMGELDENDEEIIDLNTSRPDNTWLKDLKACLEQLRIGFNNNENENFAQVNNEEVYRQDPWQNHNQATSEENNWQAQDVNVIQQDETVNEHIEYNEVPEQAWQQSPNQTWENNQVIDAYNTQPLQEQQWNNAASEETPRPIISLPNQAKHEEKVEKQPVQKPVENKVASSNTGWFGGIWNRLALRPKNQMKLPDDKNPSIVWDQEKKRWVNLEEDSNDISHEIRPPPRMEEPKPRPFDDQLNANANANAGKPNMFKLQRSRNLKKSYVDVFNPGGKVASAAPLAAPPSNPAPQMNFFVPASVPDPNAPIDFLTPPSFSEPNPQMSRWSSASSLSREVQSYTTRKRVPR